MPRSENSFARALLGEAFMNSYRLFRRATTKTFSVLAAGAFAEFGSASVIQPPARIEGEQYIAIGDDVFIGPGSWLRAAPEVGSPPSSVVIEIAGGTSIVGSCVVSAVRSVRFGEKVLLARNVYIADHLHAFDDHSRAVMDQGLAKVAPVDIGAGAWLGENVYVGPGVTIGRGAVIGANAVVLADVPDFAVAVGIPARIIPS